MSRPAPAALPDLDDDAFAAKLRPLAKSVLPASIIPEYGNKDGHISGQTDNQPSGFPEREKDERRSRLSIAEHLEKIEQVRGPKRRFEYLIPVRVGEALAADAAKQGKSAATRLLEILRDSGYPVIPEDFIDLRKEKGR